MGILDHNKQWHFRVQASEGACKSAFSSAFSRGGVLRGAKWDMKSVSDAANGAHLVAVFKGRSGVGEFLNTLSQRATDQTEAAIGTEVAMSITKADTSTCYCTMWLKRGSTTMGFKNEANVIRRYMRAVETQLRSLDPNLDLSKV